MGRDRQTLLYKNQRSHWSASFKRTWINEVAAPSVISEGSLEISRFRQATLFYSYEEEDGYPDSGFLLSWEFKLQNKQNMELELSLRSFFPAEEKYGISLSRLEDDDEDNKHEQELESEEERQLELCPFSKVETQHCHSSSSAPLLKLRFQRQNEIIGENQVFRNELLDVNNIPSPEAEIDEAAGVVAVDITSQTILSDSSTHYESQNGRGDEFMIRKKLRLSKDQSAYLEATFKHNTTLNPRLKVDLAKKLNLQTRQVEVWFQNRRARTKMKQTEVECEYLKRLCEKLMEENLKLQKEAKELKAMKSSQPFSFTGFNTVSATTLTVCSSCVTTTTVADSAPSTASLATDNCDSGSTSAKHRILQQKKTRSYAIS